MLDRTQAWKLVFVSLALWIAATLYIRLLPAAIVDPLMGGLSYPTTLVFAWLSVVVIRRSAGLSSDQLLAGVSLVGAGAMMVDGVVLRWTPAIYGQTETVARLGAAWLLWGYGVSLGIALLMANDRRSGRTESGATPAV